MQPIRDLDLLFQVPGIVQLDGGLLEGFTLQADLSNGDAGIDEIGCLVISVQAGEDGGGQAGEQAYRRSPGWTIMTGAWP